VILTQSEGRAVGSARSVPGFDLYGALQHCEPLFYSFGGHAHAAGMQMPVENVPIFIEQFERIVTAQMQPEAESPFLEISAEIDFEQITSKFWRTLQRFAPFGPDNRSPIFVTRNVRDTGQSRQLDNNHVRLSLRQGTTTLPGIGFGLGEDFAAVSQGTFDIAFSLREDVWKGERVLSLQLRDVRAGQA
jgi:single-stranded-DNA-specific exonuclease